MSIKIKNKYIVLSVIILLAGTFFAGWLTGYRHKDNVTNSVINTQSNLIKSYVYKLGDLTKEAIEKDAIILSQKQAIEQGLVVKEELRKLNIKRLNEITHLKTQVEILLDSIAHTGTITHPCDSIIEDEYSAIYLPFTFKEQNKYLDLIGNFDEQGIMSMDLKVPLNLSVWTGYDKTTKRLKSVATSDNPYIKLQNITTVKTDLRPSAKWGIGIQTGYGISKDLKLSPYIGIGINRNLIKF